MSPASSWGLTRLGPASTLRVPFRAKSPPARIRDLVWTTRPLSAKVIDAIFEEPAKRALAHPRASGRMLSALFELANPKRREAEVMAARGIWVRADGTAMHIGDMTNPHLLNAHRMITERLRYHKGGTPEEVQMEEDLADLLRTRNLRPLKPRSEAHHDVSSQMTAFTARFHELEPMEKAAAMQRLARWIREVDPDGLGMASDVLETWNPTPVTVEID